MLQLINRAKKVETNLAIIANGQSYSYEQLLKESAQFAMLLLNGDYDLNEKRIGFIVEPGFDYVKVQWAIWQAGGIAVPLNPKAPAQSHEYVLNDASVSSIVVSPSLMDTFNPFTKDFDIPTFSSNNKFEGQISLPDIDESRRAMTLYTSGTTGSPKGVVTTHENINAQITALVTAWQWTADDHIINVLPLHHVHGIINVLSCAFWTGATCEFMAFDEAKLFNRLLSQQVNLFMAVPTIYYKLITYWESLVSLEQKVISEGLQKMRLMVSGSAALPVSVLEKWQHISGHTLLERYGMTEIGMAVSNPYNGERQPGHIGQPLPKVETRLVDDEWKDVTEGEQGEILIKGPAVFKEYWNKPEATQKAFTEDGWFKTGDVAINDGVSFKIIGRSSIDIIKSGGYKLSALEIEEVLREYDGISDCGVVGMPNEEWGEIVAAGLVLDSGYNLDKVVLKTWLSERIARYKIPRIVEVIGELPRNAMGKVVKNELKEILNPTK